ncbi:MAG: cytochrome d ubiquinol oxidase subunit II [Candidatus Neomarinimicrobiota bacterium]
MIPDLNTIWFFLVGILFTGYAILDGFDLGIGALHLFTRGDDERRTMINSIGPVWDGNEVWLITGGGALFAAFPEAYATVFSGFYLAFILLLFSLIFRAIAIEFRSKLPQLWWRRLWDICFSAGSIMSAFLIGLTLGNLIRGIPLDSRHEFVGSFIGLLSPYAIAVGITTVALFMMHGSIYGVLKTEGAIQEKILGWAKNTVLFFIICYVLITVVTLVVMPHFTEHIRANPWLFTIALLNLLAIANIPRQIHRGLVFRAFLSSIASIAALMLLFGIGLYPYLVYSPQAVENSLTIYNAAASERSLRIILTIALIGMPLVVAYTAGIYWVFRGKVRLDANSY